VNFRFIHAADVHLDSPLVGLSKYEGAPAELLRTASRNAFSNLVDRAIEEQVDFMVIAGDLYDGDWKDYNTGLFLSREMGRLHREEIPVFILHGNHDAESEITRQLTLPDNVTTFGSRKPETHRIDSLTVALHGQSFREAATTENLAADYPAPVDGFFNIGVLHTALEGHAAHANYAPCSVAELRAKGYSYWALGHVHEHRVVSEEPAIVFPGNLQGRHVREPGPRGAVLVEARDQGVSLERLIVDVVRWHHLEVDVSDAGSLVDAARSVGEALERVVAEHADGRPLSVRVTLNGRSPAHGELFGLEGQLRAEILSLANALGEDAVWIEKVRVRTEPELDAEQIRARADAVADLQVMLERAEQDEELMQALQSRLSDLVAKAPRLLLERVPELEAVRQGEMAELVRTVTPGLIARLLSER
jgi:DNA repair exonuclease SbcCD nuclease subunit